ncbi:MAG: hypothetical protein WKG06_14065 [Segetibacter sp.]
MEEQTIINTIINIFNGSDKHDWELVSNSFHYEVFLDYFSLSKQPGEKIKSNEIIKGWGDFLPKFTFTHHVITNFEVTCNRSKCGGILQRPGITLFTRCTRRRNMDNYWNI